MRGRNLQLAASLLTFLTINASAAVRYVDMNSASPTPPYTNWATAAVTIQNAVDAAVAGDQVLVTNGVYQTGGRAVFGAMTNRVAVNKPVTVQSVNGPAVTVIRGFQVPGTTNGNSAVRCAYLTNGAVLMGFTLTNGATRSAGDATREQNGGGVWCESTNAVVSNCVVTANSASQSGGGVNSGTLNNCMLTRNHATLGGGALSNTLNNCTLTGNSASQHGGGTYGGRLNNCALIGNSAGYAGGGTYGGTLNNCTLTGNSAFQYGGGTYGGTMHNCIVYFNTALKYANYAGSLSYCCTTPQPVGVGNITVDPQLASVSHLSASSPCRGAGNAAYSIGTDIDGEAWTNPPSIGCDEYRAGAITGPLSVGIVATFTNVAVGFTVGLTALIEGNTTASVWDFGGGVMASNQPYASHAWSAPGDYAVVLRAYNESLPAGASATVTVHVVESIHYVAADNSNPVPPYTSWATAATNIQDAIDAATVAGASVLVTNGTYASGGRAVFGAMTNRVAVTKPLILRSVNGPQSTVIQGYQVPGTTNGDDAIRCIYLTNGASLSGFTLTNGATRDAGDFFLERNGGGVECASASTVVSNCVLTGNAASGSGGGAIYGTLNNCTLSGNSVAYEGGGAIYSTLNNCTLIGNSAADGGGVNAGMLNNCLLSGNSAVNGGGAIYSTLNNCTLTGNSAGYAGGGAYESPMNNCILYFNSASVDANYSGGALNFCCTTPQPIGGIGNITNAPLFVDQAGGDLRLQSNSPCINSGNNAYAPAGSDLDGNPRLRGDTVDISAYEFQNPASVISYAWLQQYGLPTDGSADYTDADGDGLNNWQEWIAGTDPTNLLSVLQLLNPTNNVSGVNVSWQSEVNRTYFLERAINLGDLPPFSLLKSNIAGQAGTTSYTDTNAIGDGPFFYRVGVQ